MKIKLNDKILLYFLSFYLISLLNLVYGKFVMNKFASSEEGKFDLLGYSFDYM